MGNVPEPVAAAIDTSSSSSPPVPVPVLVVVLLIVVVVVAASFVRPGRYDLRGKHVVITGGSQGIGKCVAAQVLQRGADVTLMARKQAVLVEAQAEVREMIARTEQKVEIQSIDLASDAKSVQSAFDAAVGAMGKPVDVLVNCAGMSMPGVFEDLDVDIFEKQMRVNYLGSVFATRAVVPAMKKSGRGGRIVFVSSQAGQLGVFGYSAYSPSKFALVGLAQVLRMELRPYDIHVSVAYPPDTDTPGFKNENETKPKETQLISDSSGLFQPETVGKHIVAGLQAGTFAVYTGLDGWMLANLTAGMSPISSLLDSLIQASVMSLLRLISLFYLASFDGIIAKCKRERDRSQPSGEGGKVKVH